MQAFGLFASIMVVSSFLIGVIFSFSLLYILPKILHPKGLIPINPPFNEWKNRDKLVSSVTFSRFLIDLILLPFTTMSLLTLIGVLPFSNTYLRIAIFIEGCIGFVYTFELTFLPMNTTRLFTMNNFVKIIHHLGSISLILYYTLTSPADLKMDDPSLDIEEYSHLFLFLVSWEWPRHIALVVFRACLVSNKYENAVIEERIQTNIKYSTIIFWLCGTDLFKCIVGVLITIIFFVLRWSTFNEYTVYIFPICSVLFLSAQFWGPIVLKSMTNSLLKQVVKDKQLLNPQYKLNLNSECPQLNT